MNARRRPFFRRHKDIHIWISTDEWQVLKQLLYRRGETITGWVRSMIAQSAAERIPESQGAVKRIIPESVALAAMEACQERGWAIVDMAGKLTDPILRREEAKKARPYLDAAQWMADVLADAQYRRNLLEKGIRQPRHRYKDPESSSSEAPSGAGDDSEDEAGAEPA